MTIIRRQLRAMLYPLFITPSNHLRIVKIFAGFIHAHTYEAQYQRKDKDHEESAGIGGHARITIMFLPEETWVSVLALFH